MKIKISKPFLWFPVDGSAGERKLEFFLGGRKVQEIDVCLSRDDRRFYVAWDAREFLGRELTLRGLEDETESDLLVCRDNPPVNEYPWRPKLHFSPYVGWNNDPNGMVFENGTYHLYYQWNPYGVRWGNMHWGHAKSSDLIHWEHCPMALSVDEKGTVYSGCCFPDRKGTAGFGKDALLFYYTAAGGRNQWSRDAKNLFTQRLAVSVDHGHTLQKSDRFLMDHIAAENRDPKVFFHPETNAYIMILYLDGYEFAIYRSEDLLNFQETQRIWVDGMWECPDLMKLPVCGTDQEKWVFWSADGYYQIGSFDGYCFTADSPRKSAYATRLPYAAQSFAGLEDQKRTVHMAWHRLKNTRGNYCGVMSLPLELTIRREGEEERVSLLPAREVMELPWRERPLASETSFDLEGVPHMLHLKWDDSAGGYSEISVGEAVIGIDFERRFLRIDGQETDFGYARGLELLMVFDEEVFEIFGEYGTIYGAMETEERSLEKKVVMKLSAPCQSISVKRLEER